MKAIITAIFLGAIFIVPPSKAEAVELNNSVTEVRLQLKNGSEVEIVLKKRALDSSFPYESALMWGGDDDVLPKAVLSMLSVKVAGKVVFIPLSAYADLGAVRDASVGAKRGGFNITILGGDASSAYRAVLQFRSGLLKQRQVASQEFPNQVWQSTSYSFNTDER
jgi:hypothetical protein